MVDRSLPQPLVAGRLRTDRWPVANSLVVASEMTSARTIRPSTSAVAAGITRVKSPATGSAAFVARPGRTSAAELGRAPRAGLGDGAISGRMPEMLPGLTTELVVVTAAGIGSSVGAAASDVAEAIAERVGDGDGDGLADAGRALTVTDPVAAGKVVIGGLTAASAVAISVTKVPEAALDPTLICACI